jgi:hypothetical protein
MKFQPGDLAVHRATGTLGLVLKGNALNTLLDVDGRKRGYPTGELELVAPGEPPHSPVVPQEQESPAGAEAPSRKVAHSPLSFKQNGNSATTSTPDRASNTANSPDRAVDADAVAEKPVRGKPFRSNRLELEFKRAKPPTALTGLNRMQLGERLGLTVQAIARWHQVGDDLKVALMSRKHDPEGIAWFLNRQKYYPLIED